MVSVAQVFERLGMYLLDCTLRDGGYYNNWDFSQDLIVEYLAAMNAASVDYVELGFRSFDANGFKGACAYTTDDFIRGLQIPDGLLVGVMVNAAELLKHPEGPVNAVKLLFDSSEKSPVSLVRLACHLHEFKDSLLACEWLKRAGYKVGINLMQIADCPDSEIERIGELASNYSLNALYFADSMGSMNPERTAEVIQILRRHWHGEMGVHTHDNMGLAVANSLRAINEGVTWVDCTVTGMGRGPGNAQTEYMVIELEKITGKKINLSPLLALIRQYFGPMQIKYGWGKNPYYYLAGQFGIHPTYIQEMLSDARYGEAEILSVIEYLSNVGGKKFTTEMLDAGRQMYGGESIGSWVPAQMIEGREVLVIGAGSGVIKHRQALQQFIRKTKPFVIALNTQSNVDADLIDIRAACYPVRLLADCDKYKALPQPLVVPATRLQSTVIEALGSIKMLDFGLEVRPNVFEFGVNSAVVPSSLVIAYVLAIATSGKATRILLAGFDGYGSDDARTIEVENLLAAYRNADGALPILSITPTRYKIASTSVYAI